MRSIFALSMLALAGLSAAQDQQQQNYPYTIDPNSVSSADRQKWCDDQQTQCPLICLQQPDVSTSNTIKNDCDPDALTYECVCDNNVSPNVTEYTSTLPFHICQEWGNQCVANCNNDNTCQNDCRADHPCGAQNPYKGNATASAKSSSASKTGDAAASSIPVTGFGGAQSTGSPGSGAGAALRPVVFEFASSYSLVVVFASVFAGFAILL